MADKSVESKKGTTTCEDAPVSQPKAMVNSSQQNNKNSQTIPKSRSSHQKLANDASIRDTPNTTMKSTHLKFPRSSNQNMDIYQRVASEPIEVRVSKALAAILRHGKMGFSVDPEGFVFVDDILAHEYFLKLNVTMDIITKVCNEPVDGIKRFLLTRDDQKKKVRAIQGHTVDVQDLDLIPLTLDDTMHMPFVIHGTFWKAWDRIKHNGLKLMNNRTHLHFQPGTLGKGCEPADLVVRFRNNCEVLIYVDLAKALESGIRFYRSTNNVVMTKGDRSGRIPPRFFLKAVHISPTTGEQIWIEAMGNSDCVSQSQVIRGLEKDALIKEIANKLPQGKKANKSPPEIKKPRGPNPHPSRSRNTSYNYPTNNSRSRNTSERTTPTKI